MWWVISSAGWLGLVVLALAPFHAAGRADARAEAMMRRLDAQHRP